MGEGDKSRWVVAVGCDNCNFLSDIPVTSEEQANRLTILMREKRRVSTHKDYEPNTSCDGDIHVRKITDTEKGKKKKDTNEQCQKNPLWTLKNMAKTSGLKSFLNTLDRMVRVMNTPNPFRRNGILLVGPYGSGKSIMVRAALNDEEYKKIFFYKEASFSNFTHDKVDEAVKDAFESIIQDAGNLIPTLYIDEISSTIATRKKAPRVQQILIDAILREMTTHLNVLVIGSLNDTSGSDHSIINSGRFDIIGIELANSNDERTQVLRAHIEVGLGYLTFDDRILNGLDKYIKFHNNFEGRDYENWTIDVSDWFKLHKKDGEIISEKEFVDSLSARQQIIISKKEKRRRERERSDKNEECPDCGSEDTISIGLVRGKPRRKCKSCKKTFYSKKDQPSMIKEMAISIVEWTGETLENIYKKYNVKIEHDGVTADPELTREYNNLKKINDMKKEFDRINKEE